VSAQLEQDELLAAGLSSGKDALNALYDYAPVGRD
jgi:hypothetical protein